MMGGERVEIFAGRPVVVCLRDFFSCVPWCKLGKALGDR